MNLEQMAAQAMKRIAEYVNRAAAQHLFHMRKKA